MNHNTHSIQAMTRRYRRHTGVALTLVLTLLGLSGTSIALAEEHAPDARLMRVADMQALHKAAGVPDDYVQTPFGYFPPACVHHVGSDERILKDGSLQRADGVRERIQACTQDNFTSKGIRVHPNGRSLDGLQIRGDAALTKSKSRGSVPPPITHDWVQSAVDVTSTKIGRIVASWTVPQNPTNAANQTVYFFPGIQSDDPTILQPVLGYRGYKDSWDLSSWNCCKGGTVWHSDFIPANAGDQIVGDTYATCNNGSPCSDWNVDTRNITSGQSVQLSTNYDIDSDTHIVVGGALEVYSVDSCDQYPPDGSITFDKIGVYNYNLRPVRSPFWTSYSDSSDFDVQCNYSVQTTPTSVTISY